MARYVCRHGLIAWRQAGSISGGGGGGAGPTGTMKRLPAQVRSRGGHVRSFGVAGSGGSAPAPSLPTIGQPVSDTTAGSWVPSFGVSLSAMLDEAVPDDADYISTNSTGSACELALNETVYPGTAVQTVSYRASSSTGNGITVTLKQGATVIATWSHSLTAVDSLYTQVLSPSEIALITSGPLSVQLVAT